MGVQDAEAMRDAEQQKKDTVQAKNDAETLSYQVEKQLSELKEKMSTADADELKKKLEDVRSYSASGEVDLEELKKKTADLQEKSWAVTQAAYQSGSADQSSTEESKGKEEKSEEKQEKK